MERMTNLPRWLSAWVALMFVFATPAISEATDATAEVTETVETQVQAEADDQTAERRKKIIQEAIDALAETRTALKALEEQRVDDALEALAVTTGKLELIVARDPRLGLAPTDVSMTTYDVYGSPAAIRAATKQAEDALKDGNVQEARRILAGLSSEIVYTVTNLPLATYPDAIKAITPLIDAGKIDEAKAALQAALNTLVLTDHIVPLPALRAESFLARAEELAEKEDRSDADNEALSTQLAAARMQLEMAELLGYGEEDDFKDLYAQLDGIEMKTADGGSGQGFFDEIKQAMSNLWGRIVS